MTPIMVITTCANEADAKTIAQTLIEKRDAACVQIIGPISSMYHWENAIQDDIEWQCHIKSDSDYFDRIKDTLNDIHPYNCPEIIGIPVTHISKEYETWLNTTLTASKKE